MEAYCVKCKTKREIKDPQALFNANGTPATRGVCPECGTSMYRMGRTPAHESLTPPDPDAKRKGKLVIVESPAKARTVGRFLGKEYTVKASIGHVRDLLRSQLSVDVENGFTPKYRVPKEKREVVKELQKLAKKHAQIYLATDPDREGEAIAWHLVEAAKIPEKFTHRVAFHEITEPAITEAFENSRSIDMDLVNAQQARRILDRLVGYSLSPLLWRKVRGRLSAGRVQSVALRMVVEREQAIDDFEPQEYWTIAAEFRPEGLKETFVAKLARIDESEPTLSTEADVQPLLADMEGAAYSITHIKRGQRRRSPAPPFITSTLQQDASRKLGYTTKRTMALAQQLYEGVDVGDAGAVGLITYMRTDSTNVAETAQTEARAFVAQRYGESFLPEKPPKYTKKAVGAQEAHEAVRPTSVLRQPEGIKEFLSRDQFRLYRLIWQRFVASQMSQAIFDTLSVEVTGQREKKYLLRAAGSSVNFLGFLIVYEEAKDEDQKDDEDENTCIPDGIAEGQVQELCKLLPEQHFTQPPPRYSEATLVRALEENGIGRPSTYAVTMGTLQARGYVVRENKKLIPTETGITVNELISEHFPNIVDLAFTANMEADLDRIASGEQEWTELMRGFYGPFAEQVQRAEELMPELKSDPEPIGRECPKCGQDLVIRWGRYGKFISCSGFPDCRYTEPWLEKIGINCPKDSGDIVQRKTRKGRTFYGCSNYPECDFTSWKLPLSKPCPACSGLLVVANKRKAQCLDCEETFLLDDVVEDALET